MKTFAIGFVVAFGLLSQSAPAVNTSAHDPCRTTQSNVDMRECYTKAHVQVEAQLNSYVRKIATALTEATHKHRSSTVPDDILRKAASRVAESQKAWNTYRADYCTSVEDSYTTGSGAGTAYEECMFHLAQARLQELHRYFGSWLGERPGKNDPASFLL